MAYLRVEVEFNVARKCDILNKLFYYLKYYIRVRCWIWLSFLNKLSKYVCVY